MADEKKLSNEETEKNNNNEEKRDKLSALMFDDDEEDYDETSDEAEFDAFMAEYRDLIGKKLSAANVPIHEEPEEEDPEDVLVSLPKRQPKRKKNVSDKKSSTSSSDWDDKITLAPEEYDDGIDESDMHNELPNDSEPSDINIGIDDLIAEGNEDDSFQLSFNFGNDDEAMSVDHSTEETPTQKYDPEKPRILDWVFDIAEMFVFVLLAVMILTSFIFRHSIVEGDSMMNTLEDGDHLIISDLFYTPERYDIVVFEDYSTSLRKAVIKRVIGLPGDTVEVRLNEMGDITVYVNGELIEEDYTFNAKDAYLDPNTLNKTITVPEGEIFVLGDNRYHSTDSRVGSVGTIRIDAVLGKVIIRFFPFDKFGTVD